MALSSTSGTVLVAFRFALQKRHLPKFLPDNISSDLYNSNVEGPVFDQVTTLSKFLWLGMPLYEFGVAPKPLPELWDWRTVWVR